MGKKRLSRHDKAVLNSLKQHKARGCRIKYADLPGFKKPPTMHGSKADLIIQCGKKTIIKEFENKRSHRKDTPQRKNLKKFAREHKNFSFRKVIIKS